MKPVNKKYTQELKELRDLKARGAHRVVKAGFIAPITLCSIHSDNPEA